MHYREAAANLLTNPALDPYAKIPEFKVCAVHIEPVTRRGERFGVDKRSKRAAANDKSERALVAGDD
jgi:predicted molibdopterin-dependent oxidoreductase YjgC